MSAQLVRRQAIRRRITGWAAAAAAVALIGGAGAVAAASASGPPPATSPGLPAGVPRYYVEVSFSPSAQQTGVVRSTVTGAITGQVRCPSSQSLVPSIAAADRETFFVICQQVLKDGTGAASTTSTIYRFHVTGAGRTSTFSPVPGGVLAGLSPRTIIAAPDGSEVAVSAPPAGSARAAVPTNVWVINTTSGATAVWHGAPNVQGAIRYGITDMSLTRRGKELVFLTRPHCVHVNGRPKCSVKGGEEVRSLSPASAGGLVRNSRLLLRQSSLAPLNRSFINGVTVSPNGSTLSMAFIRERGRLTKTTISVIQVSASTGRLLRTLYSVHTGEGFSFNHFGVDPSGRHFMLDAGRSSAAVNGWINHGRLVRLKPAGNAIFTEAW